MSLTVLAARQPTHVAVGNPLVPRGMQESMQLADMMARCKVGIPEHLRNSPGDCLMVIEVATRWNMSPFAVAQCTNKVKDKLGYEGKIIHAAIESSGVIDGYVDYQFSGDGESRSIRVIATRRGETEPRDVVVHLRDARTNNEWWKKTPDQMLVYHGARVWARRWTPGVILGVYAPDEFDAAQREPAYAGTTIEAQPESVELHAAPAEKPKPTPIQWFTAKIATLTTRDGCFALLTDGTRAKEFFDKQSEADQIEIKAMLADRAGELMTAPAEPTDDAFPGDAL